VWGRGKKRREGEEIQGSGTQPTMVYLTSSRSQVAEIRSELVLRELGESAPRSPLGMISNETGAFFAGEGSCL